MLFIPTDVDIQNALLAISAGKLPANDDRLIELIEQDLRDVLIAKADEPTVAIEAVVRRAQEAVSKVTAAYTTAIFRSFADGDAQQIFTRFQNTIGRIVEIAKGGNIVHGFDPESSTRFTDDSRI